MDKRNQTGQKPETQYNSFQKDMLTNFFKKKEVKFLGRGGMILNYQNNDYIIDSEMLFGEDFDIVIYTDSIQFKDTKASITEAKKKEILDYLIDYLVKRENLRIELFPK